ncbi:MAG: carboxymuconolactone decarboxylase family protein, partial [Euryarchaeota archaeon]|nr:carboxymuconolactone decarboxylase family protein [Euryarchaeota archaeon]
MDERTKELVAIAASVAGHCQPCFRHHLGKAKELGIE